MIGIICAMQIEADGVLALCENKNTAEKYGMTFTTGTLNGKELVVVVCGIGKVNAAMCASTLINDYKPELVINSGVAGALSPLVTVGDIVIGTKAVEHDMNTTALGDKQGEVTFTDGKVLFFDCDPEASRLLEQSCAGIDDTKTVRGIIASGDVFVSDRKKRMLINDRFGALACEMEGAAIGHVCFVNGVDFLIVRAVSDSANENSVMDFPQLVSRAAVISSTLVEKMLEIL